MKKKSICISVLLVFLIIPFFATDCLAEYPDKAIKVIVPWAVGGATDTTARTICAVAERYLPVPLAIINRPGAGSTIGTAEIAKAVPDGYTVGINTWGALVTHPHVRKLPYTMNDLIPLFQIVAEDSIIVAYPDRPYNNMKDFMEYAKGHPKQIKVGIHAPKTTGHFAFLQLQHEHNVEFKLIPMGGGGPMKTAILGGHIDVAPLSISEAMPYIQAGKLKALGVTGTVGVEDHPEILTCAKQGYPAEAALSMIFLLPKGIPAEKIKILNDAFMKAIKNPQFLKMAKALNLTVAYLDKEATLAKLKKYSAHYAKLVEIFGLAEKK